MCLATVFIEHNGQREQVMQDVAWIKPADGGLQLTTMLGESRRFEAQIESIDLMNSLIVLKRMTTGSPEKVPVDRRDKPV